MPTGRSYTVAVLAGLTNSVPSGIGEHSRLHSIDRDDFDVVLAGAVRTPVVDLPFPGELRIQSWWDFHPDSMLERVTGLARLAEARGCLDDPVMLASLLEQAGAAVRPAAASSEQLDEPAAESASDVVRAEATPDDGGELLDSILGDRPVSEKRASGQGAVSRTLIERVIHEIVEESGGVRDLAAEDRWRSAIDEELCARLAMILEDPGLRRLEATWAGIRRLVRAVDDASRARILVADYGRTALERDVASGTRAAEWAIAEAIRGQDPLPGERGVDLIVTDHAFGASLEDQQLLRGLLALSDSLGVPLLAGARGSATHIEEATEEQLEEWTSLQRVPGAELVGLCAPRYLARAPYAPDGESVEGLDFAEALSPEAAAGYCWSSAAFLVGEAIVRAACSAGGVSEVAHFREIEALPIHVARVGGEVISLGPMEKILTEALLEAWSWMGIVPVTGVRGTDGARILEIRSLARSLLLIG